jgi:MFS family permease
MLLVGFYYKKVSIRIGTSIAAFCAGIAFVCYSFSHEYASFCVAAAISGLSYGFGSMIPVSILMNRWFVERNTLALGICASGSGIATVALPSITTLLIENISLSLAFLIESSFIFVATAIIFLFLRDNPSKKALLPYGMVPSITQERNAEMPAGESWSLSKKVWILMGCVSLFMGALANSGFSHLAILYTTEGSDSMLVAWLITSLGVVLVAGKLIFGQVTDKIGGHKSSLLFGAILLIGYCLCCLATYNSFIINITNVLFIGIGYPIATIGPSVWASDLASRDQFPKVIRRLQVIYAAGALIFASVPGILADRFGSYIPAYDLFSALLVVSLILIELSYRSQAKGCIPGTV